MKDHEPGCPCLQFWDGGDDVPCTCKGIPTVEYRGYKIEYCDSHPGYTYAAEDYDGAPDGGDDRCGWAATIEAAKEDIDALEDQS